MKLSKSIFVLLGTIGCLSQVGCGVYYPYDYTVEGTWVAEEPVVVPSHGYFSQDQITFNVSWNPYSSYDDPIVSLITPFSYIVEDGGPAYDGCFFSDTHDESLFKRVSVIHCDDPYHGTYDVQIDNPAGYDQNVTLEVIQETRNPYGIDQLSSHTYSTVMAGSSTLISYDF